MNNSQADKKPLSASILVRLAAMALLSGIILGQLIDFAYPISDSLHYHKMVWKLGNMELCWFIDILYGVAGIIIWVGYALWDRKLGQKPVGGFNPGWGITLTSVVFFVAQFYIGPYLSGRTEISNAWIFAFTMSTTILCWWLFDRTRAGVYMMVIAGTLGPVAEITMINVLHIYNYTRPDILGVPLWFIGAYTCGMAPCGNLARKYLTYLERG